MSKSRKGNALVETALAFPVLVLIVVGVFDYGRIFSTNLVAGNAARAGAQVAILSPERFAGSDFAAAIGEVEAAVGTDDRRQRVEVTRFSECPGAEQEQAYPANCPGAAGYLRIRVSLPLEPAFRYPGFPSGVAEAAVVRIN